MKKTLFMCALGLTIASSMVAGTMAIYTHQDEVLNDRDYQAIAKTFYINAEKTTNIEDMKLAPGESDTWSFQVTNKDKNGNISEVDTDVLVAVEFGSETKWQDFSLILKDENNHIVAEGRPVNGKVEFKDQTIYAAGVEKTMKYTMEFKWLDKDENQADLVETLDDASDTALVQDADGNIKTTGLPETSGIKVTVTGNQHV